MLYAPACTPGFFHAVRHLADAHGALIPQAESMHIRPATPEDYPALKPMLLDMGFVENETALEQRFPDYCGHPDYAFLVAQSDGGEVVGYAFAQDYGTDLRSGDSHRTAKLHDLYTRPEYRQQGVGRTLMQAVTDWARGRPLRYVFWYANTHTNQAIYERMGYQAADAGQEGFAFFEIDLGDPATRTPHPTRGS